ncbi:MAG: hypothetical protein AAFO81_05265 [Pseudomonadota bacterium]
MGDRRIAKKGNPLVGDVAMLASAFDNGPLQNGGLRIAGFNFVRNGRRQSPLPDIAIAIRLGVQAMNNTHECKPAATIVIPARP